MRQCFKNIPAKFQSRPTFLAGFFSKRVTDDDDWRKTFFLNSRGEDSSLIHRAVTMEYRSSVPTRDRGSAFFASPHTPRALQKLQLSFDREPVVVVELRTFVPDHVAIKNLYWFFF